MAVGEFVICVRYFQSAKIAIMNDAQLLNPLFALFGGRSGTTFRSLSKRITPRLASHDLVRKQQSQQDQMTVEDSRRLLWQLAEVDQLTLDHCKEVSSLVGPYSKASSAVRSACVKVLRSRWIRLGIIASILA